MVIAALSFPFSRRIDIGIVLVGAASVVILDLDHLSIIIGLAQPIRPAHSLIFLSFTLLILEVALRRRPDLGLMVLSGSFIHMTVDAGVLSPVSFSYFNAADWRPLLLVLSLVTAALAGYLRRRTLTKKKDVRLLFKTEAQEVRNLA